MVGSSTLFADSWKTAGGTCHLLKNREAAPVDGNCLTPTSRWSPSQKEHSARRACWCSQWLTLVDFGCLASCPKSPASTTKLQMCKETAVCRGSGCSSRKQINIINTKDFQRRGCLFCLYTKPHIGLERWLGHEKCIALCREPEFNFQDQHQVAHKHL